ncbi:SAM-dependent methyltransferase [Streptomyces sp. NPDC087440]|uniref:SAM-dependent methyltransferase n=1 Tax=Streptomyces sp. NPDC087440 TaxID=3365790 RepID=UPI0037FF4246
MNKRNTAGPNAIDVDTPSVARMYDWLLGGIENYQSDRDACAELLDIAPSTKELALNNRNFLRRVVRVLAKDYQIRQFVDHGSGLPTQDNVHQIAQRVDPATHVVYIDNDPIVLAHGRTTLEENEQTAIIQADMREQKNIVKDAEYKRLIDHSKPTAALFVSVLHCIPDEDARTLVDTVRARLNPGDFMVICQLASERADVRDKVTHLMDVSTGGRWGRVRKPEEVEAYFEGLEILDPGVGDSAGKHPLCDVTNWRADSQVVPRQKSQEWIEWGGVGRVL